MDAESAAAFHEAIRSFDAAIPGDRVMKSFDPQELRAAFASFMTGVTVVTARTASGEPVGFTANSFTSVSLDPPLLLVCPGRHLSRFPVFESASGFGVSILSEGQEEVSNLFASGRGDRFALCDWEAGTRGVPMIAGRSAGFECAVHDGWSFAPGSRHRRKDSWPIPLEG